MENSPQFVKQTPFRERSDRGLLAIIAIGPLVAGAVILFWLALDDPPLEWLGGAVLIGAMLVTIVGTGALARERGLSLPAAVLTAIVVAPLLVIPAMFVLIAGAFMLGGMVNDLLG
jgi:hypothetical protein